MSGINQYNIAEAVGGRLANHVWWIFCLSKKATKSEKTLSCGRCSRWLYWGPVRYDDWDVWCDFDDGLFFVCLDEGSTPGARSTLQYDCAWNGADIDGLARTAGTTYLVDCRDSISFFYHRDAEWHFCISAVE